MEDENTKLFKRIFWIGMVVTFIFCIATFALIDVGSIGWAVLTTILAFISMIVAVFADGTYNYLKGDRW